MRRKTVDAALADVKTMTLTVIDGDFPREVLGAKNLSFAEYRMPARRNTPEVYDARLQSPRGPQQGLIHLGRLDDSTGHGSQHAEIRIQADRFRPAWFAYLPAASAVIMTAVFMGVFSNRSRRFERPADKSPASCLR